MNNEATLILRREMEYGCALAVTWGLQSYGTYNSNKNPRAIPIPRPVLMKYI